MENTLKSHLIALMATEFLPLTPDLAQKAYDFMVVWWEITSISQRFNWNQSLDNFAPIFVHACEELIMDILMSIA